MAKGVYGWGKEGVDQHAEWSVRQSVQGGIGNRDGRASGSYRWVMQEGDLCDQLGCARGMEE